MPPAIPTATTALYAALLGLLCIGLSARVVCLRARRRVNLGDGNDPALQRAIRVHAHFAEYVPLLLVLMLLLEIQGTSTLTLHAYGLLLLLSRALHAIGVSRLRENLNWRLASMVCTFTLLSGAAVGLLQAWYQTG